MGGILSQLWPSLYPAEDGGASFMNQARNVDIHNSNVNVVRGNQSSQTHITVNKTVIILGSLSPEAAIVEVRKKLGLAKLPSIQQNMYGERTEKTGQWFIECEDYTSWWTGDGKILWITGIPGAGKSHIAACAINHGLEQVEVRSKEGRTISVCYVYFQYSDPKPTVVILRSLVRQQAEHCPQGADLVAATIRKREDQGMELSQADCIDLLKHMCALCDESFFYFDGLDESPVDAQFDFIKICSEIEAKICIFSRPLEVMQSHVRNAVKGGVTFTEIRAQDVDLDLLIEAKINSSPEFFELLGTNPGLKGELASKVKDDAQGMFLHAFLHLDELRQSTTVAILRQALAKPPPSIGDMYQVTLDRIDKQSKHHAKLGKAVLLWVTYAERQMTVEELQHALAIDVDAEKLDWDSINSERLILSVCCGLVVLSDNSGSKELRLMHLTAKDAVQALLRPWYPHPHSPIAGACMAMLVLSGRVSGDNSTDTHGSGDDDASRDNDPCTSPFVDYANNYFATHIRGALEGPTSDTHLQPRAIAFLQRCTRFRLSIQRPDAGSSTIPGCKPPHVAVACGIPTLLKHLIEVDGMDPNCLSSEEEDGLTTTPLLVACLAGCISVMEYLLSTPGIDVQLGIPKFGVSPLMWTAQCGAFQEMELILQCAQVDVNAQDHKGTPVLMVARRKAIPRLLGVPGINVNLVDRRGRSLLHHAISRTWSSRFISSLLTIPGINVNIQDTQGRTPLHYAIDGERLSVALKILQVDGVKQQDSSTVNDPPAEVQIPVDVNLQDSLGRTPFHLAIERGFTAVALKILQVHGAKVPIPMPEIPEAYTTGPRQSGVFAQIMQLMLDKVEAGQTFEANVSPESTKEETATSSSDWYSSDDSDSSMGSSSSASADSSDWEPDWESEPEPEWEEDWESD